MYNEGLLKANLRQAIRDSIVFYTHTIINLNPIFETSDNQYFTLCNFDLILSSFLRIYLVKPIIAHQFMQFTNIGKSIVAMALD